MADITIAAQVLEARSAKHVEVVLKVSTNLAPKKERPLMVYVQFLPYKDGTPVEPDPRKARLIAARDLTSENAPIGDREIRVAVHVAKAKTAQKYRAVAWVQAHSKGRGRKPLRTVPPEATIVTIPAA